MRRRAFLEHERAESGATSGERIPGDRPNWVEPCAEARRPLASYVTGAPPRVEARVGERRPDSSRDAPEQPAGPSVTRPICIRLAESCPPRRSLRPPTRSGADCREGAPRSVAPPRPFDAMNGRFDSRMVDGRTNRRQVSGLSSTLDSGLRSWTRDIDQIRPAAESNLARALNHLRNLGLEPGNRKFDLMAIRPSAERLASLQPVSLQAWRLHHPSIRPSVPPFVRPPARSPIRIPTRSSSHFFQLLIAPFNVGRLPIINHHCSTLCIICTLGALRSARLVRTNICKSMLWQQVSLPESHLRLACEFQC